MLPSEASLRGRIGAYALQASHDPRDTTANARAAFLERFSRQVDPACSLAPEERERRAAAALRAHMLRLALSSVRSRRHKAAQL